MNRLSRVEEYNLIKKAMADDFSFLNNGSSRAVFEIDKDIVIKIAYDKKGQYQNAMEISRFRNFGSEYLATIYSYGKYVVVMEKLDVLDDETVSYAYDEDFDKIKKYAGNEYDPEKYILYSNEIIKTVDFLNENIGNSYDNYQVGISKDGRVVSFDYGFDVSNRDICVSEIFYDTISTNGSRWFLETMLNRVLSKR